MHLPSRFSLQSSQQKFPCRLSQLNILHFRGMAPAALSTDIHILSFYLEILAPLPPRERSIYKKRMGSLLMRFVAAANNVVVGQSVLKSKKAPKDCNSLWTL